MASVGKTALVKAAVSSVARGFDILIWSTVGRVGTVSDILENIGSQVGLSFPPGTPDVEWRRELTSTLKGKKFLFVVDDMGSMLMTGDGIDLESIGISPSCYEKSKVVLVSRSRKYLINTSDGHLVDRRIQVRPLDEEDSWELFCREMGTGAAVDHPSIRPLAETVAAKCGGLPLALIKVARAMANARTAREWENATELMNASPSRLPGMEDVLDALKSDFDEWEDKITKQCLLYCSLFPEDHNIDTEQLGELWVAEGLVAEWSSMIPEIIIWLTDDSLLIWGGYRYVKMHNAVRMMALRVTSDRGPPFPYGPRADLPPSHVPGRNSKHDSQFETWRDAKRLLLMHKEMGEPGDMPEFPHLITSVFSDCTCSNSFLRNLLLRTPVLRSLNLSDASIVGELPAEIGLLVGLRYLNLSGTGIGQLPAEVGSLVNLVNLNLSRTGITELPAKLWKLTSLRHLHLRETRRLSSIPPGTIECLTQLRTLDIYQSSFRSFTWKSPSSSTGINLPDLIDCLRSLETLGLSTEDADLLMGPWHYNKERRQLPLVCSLELISGTIPRRQYVASPPVWTLQELRLVGNCHESLDLELEWLSVLHLSRLQQDSINVRAHVLRLRELHMDDCHGFRELSWVAQLRSLEYLRLEDCDGMEELLVGDPPYHHGDVLPCLKKISLCRLPRLTSISRGLLRFQGLVELEVNKCPNLTSLPLDEQTARTMRRIVGEREWWDKLEFSWESFVDGKRIRLEDTCKVAFRRHFRPSDSFSDRKGVEVLHKFESSSSAEDGAERLHETIGFLVKQSKRTVDEIESCQQAGEIPKRDKKGKVKLVEEIENFLSEEERKQMTVGASRRQESGGVEIDPIACTSLGVEFASSLEKLQKVVGSFVYAGGQEKTISIIREHLQNDGVKVIGIQGIGGFGKSTILKKLRDDLCSKQDSGFDAVIMVTVSKYFQHKKKMQKEIGDQLGLSLLACGPPFLEDVQAAILHEALSKKNFLLILDGDRGMDLDKIGIPLPSNTDRCKIIFATDVVKDMQDVEVVKISSLDESESWELFSRQLQDDTAMKDPNIETMVKQVASKCDGLPLALITVGRAMKGKKRKQDWQDAVEKLDGLAKDHQARAQPVHYALKFSYDCLKGDTLRNCFLFCSLFPENENIDVEKLIQYWFGDGLLHDIDIDSAHKTGHSLINQLKAASLIENGTDKETEVKMHDVIREMALYLTSSLHGENGILLVYSGRGLTCAPEVEKWRWATRISLMHNEIEILPAKIPMCPILSTLLINRNTSLKRIPKYFFRYIPALRVLDLSCTGIEELPRSVGLLSNLQFLNISHTCIKSLPKDLGNLVQLRQLDLSYMSNLVNMPQKVILRLSNLQILNLYNTDPWCMKEQSHSKQKGACIMDLKNLGQLRDLRLTIKSVDSLEELESSSTLLQTIRSLSINQIEDLKTNFMSDILGKLEKLEVLHISEASQIEELKFQADQLQRLKILSLEHLPRATFTVVGSFKHIPLQMLRHFHIIGCHGFKDLKWVDQLPSLEYLELRVCYGIEELTVVDGVEEEEVITYYSFPKLRILLLWDLPGLKRISRSSLSLPFLEYLDVFHCPKLKKLPFTFRSAKMIKEIHGHREWWDGLEWEHEGVNVDFVHHFKDSRNHKETTSRLRLLGSNY